MKRREFLLGMLAAHAAPAVLAAQTPSVPRARTRIRQSVMNSVWTGANYSFEERCKILARIGFKGVDLPYRFIANAIADLGYTGFVAHEFRPGPGRDPIRSLEQCFEIMNV